MIKRIESLMENNNIEIQDIELFEYGLSLLLNYTITTLIILSISLYLKLTLDIIVFCLTFLILRSSTGGFHAKSKYSCFLLSISITIVVPLLLKRYIIAQNLLMVINIIMFCIIFKYLPIENENKPLSVNEKDFYKKRAIILYIAGYVVLCLISFLNLAETALVFSAAMLINSLSVSGAIIQNILYKHKKKKGEKLWKNY